MQRLNIMVSDESKAILKKYQHAKGFAKLDDALDALIKEQKAIGAD
jgi:hypothetical protein